MKRRLLAAALCLMCSAPLLAGSFSFKITGGVAAISGGDYNKGVQGSNDLNVASYSNVNGVFRKLNRGLDLGVEGILQLTPRLGVGLGVGYCRTREGDTVSYDWSDSSGTFHDSMTVTPDFFTIPVTLNLHYSVPLGPFKVDVSAGAGVYLSWFNFDDQYSSTEFDWSYHYTWKAQKAAFGAQGGLGLELPLGRVLSLVLDVFGRYARLSDIKGSWTVNGSIGGFPYSDSGDDHYFWYYELTSNGTVYPQTALQANEPKNFAISSARKGHFDFTGAVATLGFKINL